MDTYKVLGVKVNSVDSEYILKSTKKNLFVATVNSSFILKAQKKQDFKTILNTKTDINTIDSVSIQMCLKYFTYCKAYKEKNYIFSDLLKPFVFLYYGFKSGRVGKLNQTSKRLTGVDLTKDILKYANSRKKSVLIFHRKDGLTSSLDLKSYFKLTYPNINLRVVNTSMASFDKSISNKISYDYVFCTFGEYKQETFLYVNSKNINCNTKVGVGGAFDVIVGKVKISSKQRRSGTEWFFRLLSNPKRTFKILRSVFVFPLKVYLYSIRAF